MNPFNAVFAELRSAKASGEYQAAVAAAPLIPMLLPPGWDGVPAGRYGRRLFGSADATAPDPWVAIAAPRPDGTKFTPLSLDELSQLLDRPISGPDAESLAVEFLDRRMRIDPGVSLWQEGGLALAAWEDLAASLLLHGPVRNKLHELAGATQLVVRIPTRATLIAGPVSLVEDIRQLASDVASAAGTDNVLTQASFIMEGGELIGMERVDSKLAGAVLELVE